ncbi:MAG: hypothetical protein ACRD2P_01895, partial [Terriglobia bacterium]
RMFLAAALLPPQQGSGLSLATKSTAQKTKTRMKTKIQAQSFAVKTPRFLVGTAEKPQSYKTALRCKADAAKIRK